MMMMVDCVAQSLSKLVGEACEFPRLAGEKRESYVSSNDSN